MIDIIIYAVLGASAYRIRGGAGNSFVRKTLGKPEGWEISNGIVRSVWAIFITVCMYLEGLPILWTPVAFALAFFGVLRGYRMAYSTKKTIGQFDLSLSKNRNMKNYAILTARASLIMLPNAILGAFFGINMLYSVFAASLFVVYYLIGYRTKWRSQAGEAILGGMIGASL
jgi:hypothetical protein